MVYATMGVHNTKEHHHANELGVFQSATIPKLVVSII